MNRQGQSVGTEGQGYQAGRDLTINEGLSPDQMSEIMVSLAKQLQSYFAEAEDKAEARMKELRASLLDEFAKPDSTGKREAFADPDYQFVLRDAHQSYARSGDEKLREELVKLLIERSAEPSGSRVALILNQAITTARSLTRQEYAALCAIFFFKCCRVEASDSFSLSSNLSGIISTFVHDLPFDNHPYEYLESLGLISINRITGVTLGQILHRSYAALLSFGFSDEQLDEAARNAEAVMKIKPILIPATGTFGYNKRFNVQDAVELTANLQDTGLDEDIVSRMIALFNQTLMPSDKLEQKMIKEIPSLQRIQDTWSSTAIQQTTLTGLGKVMAHSALTSRSTFRAPLSIWVR